MQTYHVQYKCYLPEPILWSVWKGTIGNGQWKSWCSVLSASTKSSTRAALHLENKCTMHHKYNCAQWRKSNSCVQKHRNNSAIYIVHVHVCLKCNLLNSYSKINFPTFFSYFKIPNFSPQAGNMFKLQLCVFSVLI